MKPFRLAITLALAACLIAAPAALGEAKTFDNESGGGDSMWNTSANWDPTGVPVACDDVTIAADCFLNVDASVGSVTVSDGINFTFDDDNVPTGHVLTVTGCGSQQFSTLSNATSIIHLDESASAIKFTTNDHVMLGLGSIAGTNNAAQIDINAAGIDLRSEVDIKGFLIITGAGNFINAGSVEANAAGTLEINETLGNVDDLANSSVVSSSSFRWAVTHASAVLLFDVEPGCLSGHFFVETGDLRVGAGADNLDVLTCGDLLMVGGRIIAGLNDSFSFGVDKPAAARP